MKIGSKITCGHGAGTLGCFVVKTGERSLFAIISKHVAAAGDGAVFYGTTQVGHVVQRTDDDLDAALVKLTSYGTSLVKEDSFTIKRDNNILTLDTVFDPPPYRNTTQELPNYYQAMHLMVWHCGATSQAYAEAMNVDTFAFNSQFGVIAIADMMRGSYIFQERHNRPGDSGAPIYMDTGALVGFNGGGAKASLDAQTMGVNATAGGFYRLAADVFADLGVSLASWANRQAWQPHQQTRQGFVNPLYRPSGATPENSSFK